MKKLLAVLLSIMMLAMPLTSMAENSVWDNAARQETTITIHDLNADLVAALGGDDTVMAAINDLLAALTLTSYQQGDETGLDINLSGKSVLGMAVLATAADEDTLTYISSKLVGGVIAVNSKDTEAITEKFLRATMKMSGQSDEEIEKEIAASKEQMDGTEEYNALMEAALNLRNMDEEKFMEELAQVDATELLNVLNDMASNAVLEEVTEQPGDCDPAKNYVKVTVAPETLIQMMKAAMAAVHSMPSVGAYLDATFAYAGTSWDDLLKELDAEELYAEDVVYEYWLSEAGELVRMTVAAKVNNGGEEPLPMSFALTRNTVDGVATWLVNFKSAEDTVMTATFAGDLENFKANLTFYDGEDTVEINVNGEGVGTDNSVVDVEFKVTSSGDTQGFGAVVTTATTMDGEQGVRKVDVLVRFMGLDVVTITAETRTCDAKDAMDVSKAQDLGAMTDSEFQTWYVKVMNNVQNLPMTIMMSLPESVLTGAILSLFLHGKLAKSAVLANQSEGIAFFPYSCYNKNDTFYFCGRE